MLAHYIEGFAQTLATATGLPYEDILPMIEIPPENIPGDLAFPCFQLAKELKKAPPVIAGEMAKKLDWAQFERFEAIGGYVNAHIKRANFIEKFFTLAPIHHQVAQDKILIEYMAANPNKPLHIWHIRNVCIGDSMRRIFEHLGYPVSTCNYGDDSGVNVGYNMVGHLHYDIPLETEKKFDHYCGEIYEKMRKLDDDVEFKQKLSDVLLAIEEGTDEKIMQLHETYTKACAKEQLRSCWRIGAYFDFVAWETDVLHMKFFAYALELLKEKWFVRYADEGDAKGCRILDLSSLPAYQKEEKQYQIMIKSDGVATYTAKDIAFALWKLGYIKENFGYAHFIEDPRGVMMYTTTMEKNEGQHHEIWNYDKAITIIDNRQLPPQEIVKSALLLLDPSQQKEYLPLGYGVVYLTPQTLLKLNYTLSDEEKKEKRLPFASRKGRSVSIDEMLDMLYKKAHTETKARNLDKDDTWLEQTAEAMSVSALRFFLIRGDISKEIIFDLDEAMDMQGETGTYVLYTWARVQSIIDSGGYQDFSEINYTLLDHEDEFSLVKKMESFQTILKRSAEQLAPHMIAKFCFELSQMVNSYYGHVKILTDDAEQKKSRLFLLTRVRDTLKQAMDLIGLVFVERM